MTVDLATGEPAGSASAAAGDVAQRLQDPKVSAALNTILDHADLIAISVVALDGLLSRTEVIGEALTSGLADLKVAAANAPRPTVDLDVEGVLGAVNTLGRMLPKLTAVLERVSETRLLDALAEHADLLALGVDALDGTLRRAEEIGDAVTAGVNEIRQVAANPGQGGALDPGQVLASLVQVGAALPRVTPAVTRVVDSGLVETVLDSGITSPVVVDQISRIGRGLATAAENNQADPQRVPGALGMLRLLKDPDINRGVGFMVAALKSIGRELGEPASGQVVAAIHQANK